MKPLPVLLFRLVQQLLSIFFYGNKTIYHKLHWKNGVVEMIIIMQKIPALKNGISSNHKEFKSYEDLILTAKIIYFSLLEML